ncbi:DUF308 domain-containing protein [uncultured Castellaniella sp.]|uniref:HdeD family acid-resistance protein n=1 Tax=uncultured Castellaniella sp. TaxID=647907 RepID=UPI002620E69C|nr:DUF308 domain-containing protein [uncultured Castellaniella sp.]
MVHLIMLLLGVGYLRRRARALSVAGWIFIVAGLVVGVDALDGAPYFPMNLFAALLMLEGLATLMVAQSGVGGQRVLRYAKGTFVLLAGGMILAGHHHGNQLLALTFGLLFLADGLLQCTAAYVVRYERWRYAMAAGIAEILLAIFIFQPYPTHYVGTAPYCLGLFLMFTGAWMLMLSKRVRNMQTNPALEDNPTAGAAPMRPELPRGGTFDGPPADHEHALTVHVWTPTGSAKTATRRQPIIDRYIAAVDVNGVVSTGHAALEAPEGVYISLYPAEEIDHSPEQFGALLKATAENNVPGIFQPDYATESAAWCPSTAKVRIRNYGARKLQAFWADYRRDTTYNLTHRNCSSSVAYALEAALDGAVGRLHEGNTSWRILLRLLLTPELWVAAQIRKRAMTMAWTPGLTLDYARALSMLADPRPFAWSGVLRTLRRRAP